MSRKKRKAEKKRWGLPIAGVIVGLFVGVALLVRIVPSWDGIFVGQWIKFASNDAYYYMRLVDDMIANFPHLPSIDPYLMYPDGQPILSFHLFARLIAGISWAIGLGNPTQHLVDVVGAFVPAVMGALVVIPVYFIGKALWGSVAGLMSAALIAVLPGEFLGRSVLGFTDHHIAEVLFSTVAMLFLIMAVKKAKQCEIDSSGKVVVYPVLAGLFWGMYGLTWQGGSLFLWIICLYFVVQFVVDHLKGRDTGYLCKVGVIFSLTGMVVFLPSVIQSYNRTFYLISMGGALVLSVVLRGLSWALARVKSSRRWYPSVLLALAVGGLWVVSLVSPLAFGQFVGVFRFVFAASNTQLTTIEMQPLLFPYGNFTLSLAWGNFGLALFGLVVALVVLIWGVAKHGDAPKTIVVVWSVAILVMALGQRRFSYYLAVNVALLNGYLLWMILNWMGLGEWRRHLSDIADAVRGGRRKKGQVAVVQAFNVVIVALVLFIVAYMPLIPSIVAVASTAMYAPSNAWCESLDWLRNSSPEPFSDGNEKASYSVLSWWDYGYWITRIGHRVPNVNPGQNPVMQSKVAETFVSDDELLSSELIRELGAKYIMIDFETITGKYWAIARYAGKEQSDYFEVYYVQNGNQIVAIPLFYPRYYKALAVRLYNFDGKMVIPQYVDVIDYDIHQDAKGNLLNVVIDTKRFETYEEAVVYISDHSEYRIVSNNPFISPIPLGGLGDYELVFGSSGRKVLGNAEGISEVKIFKYVGE